MAESQRKTRKIKGLNMKKKAYKIMFGEWISVYQKSKAILVSDVEPTKENLQQLIDENGVDYITEDIDWSTVESEEIDTEPLKILEETEVEDDNA